MGIFTRPQTINRVVSLEIARITPSPYQPRHRFEEGAMRELAESIAQNGLLQPITVRQSGTGYELIAGERRLLACKSLHFERIPAIIEQYDDEKSATFALIENLQRKDLNFFEEAAGMQQLMQRSCMTQQQVAQRLGKAQSTVANKLRLLGFSAQMRQQMIEAGLTERHARALLRLPNEEAVGVALAHIVCERLNVGESEQYIDALLEPAEAERPKATRLFIVKDLRIFLNTITKAVSTMKLAGIEIDTTKLEDDNFINYTLRIPKKSAYRSHTA